MSYPKIDWSMQTQFMGLKNQSHINSMQTHMWHLSVLSGVLLEFLKKQ
jgi:hypothetical protein